LNCSLRKKYAGKQQAGKSGYYFFHAEIFYLKPFSNNFGTGIYPSG
jgi:hypothetical protein